MKSGQRIVFLHSELAGYFLACAKALGQHHMIDSVDIVHWPTQNEAPFLCSSTNYYTLHLKSNMSRSQLSELLTDIKPSAIVCSGWMDSDYNAMARKWRGTIPVVLTLDNWWIGNWRQWGAVWTSAFFIQRRFNRAWVPGEPQKRFAEKLGFRGKRLALGAYCADSEHFRKVYRVRQNTKKSKKLLYVGRYIETKGVRELWSAFAHLSEKFPEWELHCIGAGELWNERKIHPKIFHHGFKQPSELTAFIEDAACVVMPSKREPWGVVLHEMAIAGLPLLVSSQIGAATSFLKLGENGFIFENHQIQNTLHQFFQLKSDEIDRFSENSHSMGMTYTTSDWSDRLIHLISN